MLKLAAAAVAALAAVSTARADFTVREIGSFHIGGRTAVLSGMPTREITFTPGAPPLRVDPNGEFAVEQMYVQYVRLAQPRSRLPVLLWHGGGLTGVTWETTPDGRPGWQQFFLQAGYDTYVSDAVERGRASWARYPEIFASEPFFRSRKEGWELFRIGPSYEVGGRREAFEGTQFPIEAYDQFTMQAVPRWATNDAATQRAYDALVQRVCPCIIVVHSQGANFAFNAAVTAPDKVRAVVAVEPSGAPDPARVEAARARGVPHLFVWGDYIDRHAFWQRIVAAPNRWRDALREAGARVETLDLPAAGVRGNSHMLMMDRNSDEIARRVEAWIAGLNLAP
jgi:pimeloyl-ACP methyl ester carboxylesterase